MCCIKNVLLEKKPEKNSRNLVSFIMIVHSSVDEKCWPTSPMFTAEPVLPPFDLGKKLPASSLKVGVHELPRPIHAWSSSLPRRW